MKRYSSFIFFLSKYKFSLTHTSVFFVLIFFTPCLKSQAQVFNFKKDSTTNRVTINRGSRFTKTPFVTLQIAAYNVRDMQISNYPDFREAAHWIPYQPIVYGWKLKPEDGPKTVYVRFRNAQGKVLSDIATAEITLDTTPPQNPKLKIDVKNKSINDSTQLVDLLLGAEEPEKRYYVMLSNHRSFYRQRWQVAQEVEKDWRLDNKLDGVKMVFAKYRDRAGNVSEVVTDKIIIDTQGPVRPSISVVNENPFINKQSPTVQLLLSAGGASQMRVSEDIQFNGAAWEPMSRYKKWQVSAGDGEKVIYAQFKDDAENMTPVVSTTLYIDSQPPTNGSILINNGDQTTRHIDGIVELSIKADDAHLMMISNTENFAGARWIPYEELISDWRLIGENGKKTVYIKFRDEAGNESEVYKDDIILIR